MGRNNGDKDWKNAYYFGGARSKGLATLRNVPKLLFGNKIGHAKSVGFRLYSGIRRSESRFSLRCREINSISLLFEEETIIFVAWRGLPGVWPTCVTHQIRWDPKLRDWPIAPLRSKVTWNVKNSYTGKLCTRYGISWWLFGFFLFIILARNIDCESLQKILNQFELVASKYERKSNRQEQFSVRLTS